MVELKKVFEVESSKGESIFTSVKKFSNEIKESPSISSFITVEDAKESGSDIYMIERDLEEDNEPEREFIIA